MTEINYQLAVIATYEHSRIIVLNNIDSWMLPKFYVDLKFSICTIPKHISTSTKWVMTILT